jgi:hypothetical protein
MRWLVGLLLLNSLPSVLPASAETSGELLRRDIRGQYQLMKRAAEQAVAAPTGRVDQKSYDLENCAGLHPGAQSKDTLASAVALLASEVEVISKKLTWLGYPKSVWESALADYERAQLDHVVSKKTYDFSIPNRMKRPLLRRLDEYRRSSKIKLPEVDWDTACGGEMGIAIRLVTQPPRGKVQLLPGLFYRFCQLQGVQAESLRECDQWTEMSDGEEAMVLGAYWYKATWTGGATAQGRKDFSSRTPEMRTWRVTP